MPVLLLYLMLEQHKHTHHKFIFLRINSNQRRQQILQDSGIAVYVYTNYGSPFLPKKLWFNTFIFILSIFHVTQGRKRQKAHLLVYHFGSNGSPNKMNNVHKVIVFYTVMGTLIFDQFTCLIFYFIFSLTTSLSLTFVICSFYTSSHFLHLHFSHAAFIILAHNIYIFSISTILSLRLHIHIKCINEIKFKPQSQRVPSQ